MEITDDQYRLDLFNKRLKKGHITKAVKGLIKSNIRFDQIKSDLLKAVSIAHKRGNFGEILSAYYRYGQFTKLEIKDLLKSLFEKNDIPAFLKQTYRFGEYKNFPEEIEYAITWHENRKLPDAFAWRVKFEKQKELAIIELNEKADLETVPNSIRVIDEETSITKKELVFLELKPIKLSPKKNIKKVITEDVSEPYVLSRISKNKLDNANKNHSLTLNILKGKLSSLDYDVIETKHIDAFTIINGIPAIFEIKSITPENENDQVRAAISQLYEYRFLYSLTNASLWLVFSEKPFSDWILDYLLIDRHINVLWVENETIVGNSFNKLSNSFQITTPCS